MGLLDTIRGWLSDVENGAAEEVGELEDILHRPVYPIKSYQSVVDDHLMRGSWPSKAQLAELAQSGIKCVINLCSERNQDSDVKAAGMVPLNIPIRDNTPPTWPQVAIFLELVRSMAPVYVHCEEGVGRTGCMVASYRVLVQGWVQGKALIEAQTFGLRLPADKQFILHLRP